MTKLGSVSSDLSALSSFFDKNWSKLVKNFDYYEGPESLQLYNQFGYRMLCIGNIDDSISLFEKACLEDRESKNEIRLSVNLLNISDANFERGNISRALHAAEQVAAIAKEIKVTYLLARIRIARALNGIGQRQKALTIFDQLFQEDPLCEWYDTTWLHDPRLLSYRTHFHSEVLIDAGNITRACLISRLLSHKNYHGVKGDNNDAFDNLTLGWMHLIKQEYFIAEKLLSNALDSSRSSARISTTLRCLIANANVLRNLEKYQSSHGALDEVMRIAKRCGMRLHECDAHLEYARLALAEDNPEAAFPHLKSAEALVTECGYHRRDPEVAELKEKLGLQG